MKKLLIVILLVSLPFFCVGATTSQSLVDENVLTFSVHDHDTGEVLGIMQLAPYDPSFYQIPSPENVRQGMMGGPPPYGFGGQGWNILVGTTSFVSKVEVDFDDKQIYVQFSGNENVPGFFQLWISGERLVSGVQKVEVELDNFPLENVVTIDYGPTVIVYVWYTHSTRMLTFSIIGGKGAYTPIFLVVIVGLGAAVIIAGSIYVHRLRRSS